MKPAECALAARGKSHPCRRAVLSRQLFVVETHRISGDSPPFRRLDLTPDRSPGQAQNPALPGVHHVPRQREVRR